MKQLLLFVFIISVFAGQIQAQDNVTNLLPDSVAIVNSYEMGSDGQEIHALVRTSFSSYYYLEISGGNYTYHSVPYTLAYNKVKDVQIFDGDVYHLTKSEGIYIFKSDGTWDSLMVDNQMVNAYGIFKDGDKFYLNLGESLAYYDGSVWTSYTIPNNNDYTTFRKYNNKVYFNAENSGIHVFDGQSLELLIQQDDIFSFDILNDEIWYSTNNSNEEPQVSDIDGNAIYYEFDYSLPKGENVIENINNKIQIVGKSYSYHSPKVYSIVNGEISLVQHYNNLSINNLEKIALYQDGILVASNQELNYINMNTYNSFGTAQVDVTYRNLDVNMVDAHYMNRGMMFWDGIGVAKYEVPKGSGKTASFAGGLWFGAESSAGEHVAVAKFANNNGYDFFPGPLKATGASQGQGDSTYAVAFDKIWKISKTDIQQHLNNYQSVDYIVPEGIASWPAHGSVADGYAENLAPFVDMNENGIYEPAEGDYPCIKGDMTLYWIFNDNLAEHTESPGGLPLGIEIHAQAYAFNCDTCTGEDSVINYTTFLNWKVVNRSANDYTDFNTAFWTDADLGYAFDDYVGTHVGLNSMYFYNGQTNDGTGNAYEYGENPPALFHTILDGPLAEENDGVDNDNDGTVDETGERSLLSGMRYFSNNNTNNGDPETVQHYNNYLNGFWKDGRPMTFGGTGYQPSGGVPTKYMFPGESDPWLNGTMGVNPYSMPPDEWNPEDYWTEENEANSPADRRGVATVGPIDLNSGEEVEYTMAIVWSRGDNGPMSSVQKGFVETQRIIDWYNDTDIHECDYLSLNRQEITDHVSVELFPNPTTESFVVKGVDEGTAYKLFSIDGTLIQTGKLSSEPINVRALSQGVYVLDIENQAYKLIKE